jgi:hypothetical protein
VDKWFPNIGPLLWKPIRIDYVAEWGTSGVTQDSDAMMTHALPTRHVQWHAGRRRCCSLINANLGPLCGSDLGVMIDTWSASNASSTAARLDHNARAWLHDCYSATPVSARLLRSRSTLGNSTEQIKSNNKRTMKLAGIIQSQVLAISPSTTGA